MNLLISPFFTMGTYGGGFGHLKLPTWARNMITDEKVRGNAPLRGPYPVQWWDGGGPSDGFNQGEVEDYFIEWDPIGQLFPPDSMEVATPDTTAEMQIERLDKINCPEQVSPGQVIGCELTGPEPGEIGVAGLVDAKSGGAASGFVRLTPEEAPADTLKSGNVLVLADATTSTLTLDVRQAPEEAVLLVYARPREEDQRRGNAMVQVVGGTVIRVRH